MTVPIFNETFKLFVFKDEDEVSISLRLSDSCCKSFNLPLSDFQYIIDNWKEGVSGYDIDGSRWWWEYRDCGPRPECHPAHYVAISTNGWNWRCTVDEMEILTQQFNHQLVNKNHWD